MNTLLRKNGNYYPTVFDSVFGKNTLDQLFQPDYSASKPAVNVIETEAGYRLELAAPGFAKEDLKVNVEGRKLTISSEKKTETEQKSEKYTIKEFSARTFQRSFNLPETVNIEKVSANYDAGILYVELPKKEMPAANTPRQIEVV